MSANDLRGQKARVDRSVSSEAAQEQMGGVRRRRLLATTLTGLLLVVPVAWSNQDPDARDETVKTYLTEAILVQPPAPTFPLDVHQGVERWLADFEGPRRHEFEHLLTQRGLFADMIRGELRDRAMPEDLFYLAVIESGMKTSAVSRVSAVGLWQFMSPTALQYGLRVDGYVDERRDPVRATEAALDYLEYLHDRFDSWYLAAAAFNAGPGRLERLLKLHAPGQKWSDELYWEVRDYLPRETREYIPKLVAVTRLANQADAVGFAASAEPYRYDHVLVPGLTPLDEIARGLDVDPNLLADLNPHLIRGVTPPNEGYAVRIPVGYGAQVVMALAGQPAVHRADDD